MPRLDELMITEDFTPPAPGSLPSLPPGVELLNRKRTAVTPGAPLSWTERRGDLEYTRQGMVLDLGPRARSVWTVPNDPRPGEGYAVLVHDVVAADASAANRTLGVPADCWSTEEWQNPRALLPRAYLRRDRVYQRDGGVDCQPLSLHAWDPECKCSTFLFSGQRAEYGPADVVDTVYVYGRHFMHPWSIRPMDPGSYTALAGTRYVALGRCFAGQPTHGVWMPILPDEVPAK